MWKLQLSFIWSARSICIDLRSFAFIRTARCVLWSHNTALFASVSTPFALRGWWSLPRHSSRLPQIGSSDVVSLRRSSAWSGCYQISLPIGLALSHSRSSSVISGRPFSSGTMARARLTAAYASACVKSFGRREAYESLGGTNPRAPLTGLWVFRFWGCRGGDGTATRAPLNGPVEVGFAF